MVLPPMSKTCDLPPCRHREGPIDIDPRRFSLWITPTHRGRHVKAMVKADVKATDLKGLHGKIRKRGYASGDLKGHTYADSKPTLEKCKAHDVSVHIYPPRSIDAQKPPFRRSNDGDLCPLFHRHFPSDSASERVAAVNAGRSLGRSGRPPSSNATTEITHDNPQP